MKIYDNNGYCNIEEYINSKMPFIFITGGRGIGKTFGALKFAIEKRKKFIFMRRTQSQIDLVAKPEFSPINPVANYLNIEVETKSISKYNNGFYIDGELIGYAVALSTISSLRGFDASDIELLIYDEFIPEKHERPIRYEGMAFLNAIETISRNRELMNRESLQVLCLANANDLGNPIYMELNLIKIAEKMKEKKQAYYINKEKGLLMLQLDNSPISEKKKETALYKLVNNSDFTKMAIENKYISDSIAVIKSLRLNNYNPIVTIADCTIYGHKSERVYYMSEHKQGTPEEFTTATASLEKFRKKYYYLWNAYLDKKIIFENRLTSIIFEKLW